MDLERNEKLRKQVEFYTRKKSTVAEEVNTEKSRWSHWLNRKVEYGDEVLSRIETWLNRQAKN